MVTFSEPSVEQAEFFLRELDWGDHLEAVEMSPASGNRQLYLYSMREAAHLLRFGTAGMGLTSGGRSTIGWLDVDNFLSWVRNKVQDEELADALTEAAQQDTYYDQVNEMGLVFDARFAQLKEVVEEQTVEEETAE